MNTMMEEDSIEDEDEYLEDAKNIVLTMNKASTSFLQRKLGIGYSRAAKLIDQLEQKGIVGPQHGTKPREIYGASTTNSTNPPPSPSDNQI
jgi:S-DNA-T family DNA segregation ATPase FtsK/SpoIIIE